MRAIDRRARKLKSDGVSIIENTLRMMEIEKRAKKF